MLDGELSELGTSVRYTKERECGFSLTTVASSDYLRTCLDWPMWFKPERQKHSIGSISEHLARMGLKGFIKVDFHEWLMGWIEDWTDLKPLEMDKFHKWRHSHLTSSQEA